MQKSDIIKDFTIRIIKLVIGLFILAVGIVLLLYSDLGLNPWNVFQQGLSFHTPLSLGQASQVTGLVIIIVCLFFNIFPGVGTIINMIIVGIFVDALSMSGIFFTPQSIVLKFALCISGVICTAFGSYVYISQGIGAGPRDSLMMVICQNTRFTIGTVRNSIEIIVLVIGFLMGGKVGIGTVIVSLATGPLLGKFFALFKKDPKKVKQKNVIDVFYMFKDLIKKEKIV